jgi:hypothetical protein
MSYGKNLSGRDKMAQNKNENKTEIEMKVK